MLKVFLFISAFLILSVSVHCQDCQLILKEAAAAEASMQEELAYNKYKQVLKIQPDNLTALCKCSELASKIGHRYADKEIQIKHYDTARAYAERALKVNPHSADANFVMSVAMGRMAIVSSGGKLVSAVKDIKKYADKTVELNPSDFRGYLVQGKWYYEISNLSAFKRMAVKLFYGAFPDASFEDAVRCYEKSRDLNPGFNLIYLELAKAYIKLHKTDQSISLLKKLETLPLKMEDDLRIKREAAELLKSLQKDN
jgi:tetratricopeptide (TPR) repeat protein